MEYVFLFYTTYPHVHIEYKSPKLKQLSEH